MRELIKTIVREHTATMITERCWKGYTQKGMKTMFGKRYPNCVKIKKKMNESESTSKWTESDNKLTRKFKFSDYEETLDFVNKVAKIAQKQDHHPDITFGYNTAKVSITDHEKGGVSDKCHKFVKAVDSLKS